MNVVAMFFNVTLFSLWNWRGVGIFLRRMAALYEVRNILTLYHAV